MAILFTWPVVNCTYRRGNVISFVSRSEEQTKRLGAKLGRLLQAGVLGAAGVDVGRSAALIALGRLDEAEALLRAALLNAPQDARLYKNLGLVTHERGDLDAARDLFERALELAPEWDLPRQNLEGLER